MAQNKEPFDRTYKAVTVRMVHYMNHELKDPAEIAWFKALIDGFQAEYKTWSDVKYPKYWKEWGKLKGRIPNLAAGAFFHISYDLPRVIAKEWRPEGAGTCNEARTEQIYLGLTHIFEEVFRQAALDFKTTGGSAVFGYVVAAWEKVTGSDNVFAMATQWVLYLRAAAWIHGRRLRILGEEGDPQRQQAEAAMLKSVRKALRDADKWTPLMAAKLGPPLLFEPKKGSGVAAVAGIEWPWVVTWRPVAAVVAVLAAIAAYLIWRQRRRRREEWVFVLLFGRLLAAYLNVALYSREFDHDLERLRNELNPEAGVAARS